MNVRFVIDATRWVMIMQCFPFCIRCTLQVSDSGCVQIWDWRMNEKPVRSRRKAHNSSVLSVAWSPLRDAVVATGSSDRTVKVWSTEDGSLEEWDAFPSGVTVEPYTIFAGHEVWRLHWYCPDSYRTPPLLATVNNSPQLDNLGRVFVWDLVNPHLPVCTLDGHEHDLCVDFAWLSSSSSSSTRSSTAPPGPPPDKVVSSSSRRTSAGGGKSTAAAPTGWWGPGASFRGVLSVGRDGRLLVQELSSGWRPSTHMSSSVMAVSSKGHVAYHRGAQDLQVRRLSLLLLTAAVDHKRMITPRHAPLTGQSPPGHLHLLLIVIIIPKGTRRGGGVDCCCL